MVNINNFMKLNILSTVTAFPQRIARFLKEVKQELKKVTWPTRQEAINHTLIVIGASLVVAAFLGGLDFLFSFLLNKFILNIL